jgi:hypothetical protein
MPGIEFASFRANIASSRGSSDSAKSRKIEISGKKGKKEVGSSAIPGVFGVQERRVSTTSYYKQNGYDIMVDC